MKEKLDVNVETETEWLNFHKKQRLIRLSYYAIFFAFFNVIQVLFFYITGLFILNFLLMFFVSVYAGYDISRIRNFTVKSSLKTQEATLTKKEFAALLKIHTDSKKEGGSLTKSLLVLIPFIIILMCTLIYYGSISFFHLLRFPVHIILLDLELIILGFSAGYCTSVVLFIKMFTLTKGPQFLLNFSNEYLWNHKNLQYQLWFNYVGDFFRIRDLKLMLLNPEMREAGFICILIQASVSEIIYPYVVLILNKEYKPNLKALIRNSGRDTTYKWPVIFECPPSANEAVLVIRFDIPRTTRVVPFISKDHLIHLLHTTEKLVELIFQPKIKVI